MTRDRRTRRRAALLGALGFVFMSGALHGQGQPGRQGGSNPSPRDLAPLDLTGYWVSVVTEDWRYRMVLPARGDYDSVPLNTEGRRVADTWRPQQAGQCEAFGAGAG